VVGLRSLSKRIGIGAALLRLKRGLNYGARVELDTFLAKATYLRRVQSFAPLRSDAGSVDCFMLLNEARIWEGLWSLYSFRAYFGPCRIVVLNDGTLSPQSMSLLSTIFPGLFIPDCAANDAETDEYLERRGLSSCRAWRKKFVFFRKLADPVRLTQSDRIVLLDSDCLHFDTPNEILRWVEEQQNVRYIADLARYSYCAVPTELAKICGCPLPEYFCAGYLCLPKTTVSLERIEHYLSADCFAKQLATKRFSHVAEQTLYAMESAIAGAEVLPLEYATCPDPNLRTATAGHFCGGSYKRTWFYTKGLPVVRQLLASRTSN
jgi:hypothetical protein